MSLLIDRRVVHLTNRAGAGGRTTGCKPKARRVAVWLVALTALVAAVPAHGQFAFTSSISGTVTDSSGGALPGVAVTVSGPSLQQPRVVTTDAEGLYRVLELPAGAYQVRLELQGFQTLIRENFQIATAFAARYDAQLQIGGLEESITVSGASPVVDVKSTSGGQVLSQEAITTLIPTHKFHSEIARLTPGLMVNTPPQQGSLGTEARGTFEAYGVTGLTVMKDGMDVRSNTAQDFGAGAEVDVRTFGSSAEHAAPGVVFNIVTPSGGNRTSGSVSNQHISGRFESENLDDRLRSQGVTSGDSIEYYNDFGVSLGGRIVRDRLWYYGDFRDRRNEITILGLVVAPDDPTPYYPTITMKNQNTKLTWQATRNIQLVGLLDWTYQVNNGGNRRGPDHRFVPYQNGQYQTYDPSNWRTEARVTPRNDLLLNVQFGRVWYTVDYMATPEDNSNRNITTRWDRESGLYSGGVMGTGNSEVKRHRVRYVSQGSLIYAPVGRFFGSHEVKVGYRGYFQMQREVRPDRSAGGGNYILVYDRVGGVSGQPAELWTYNLPVDTILGRTRNLGAYITDQWQLNRRLTLQLGARLDNQTAHVPEQCKEAGTFSVAGCFPRVKAENLTDVSPRAAAAYDFTGSGRTVIKSSWGRYIDEIDDNYANFYSPSYLVETRYRWRDVDRNNNYTPGESNLDLNGPDFISITGAANNIFNPNLRAGNLYEFTLSLERELMANTSMRLLYVNKVDREAVANVNILRPYGAYNIPLTRRDPGPDGILNNADDGGTVTVWDYDAAYRGAAFVGNQRTNRAADRSDKYHTFEFTFNRRTSGRWGAMTSFAATKNHRHLSGIIQTPNDEYFEIDQTWEWIYKATGSYMMPGEVMVSGILDVTSGTPGQRTYIFRSADPDGGTPLRQLSTVTLRLEPFGTRRTPVKPGLNLRVSKFFNIGPGRLQVAADLFNAMNSNAVWGATWASGPTFGYASTMTKPRTVQLLASYKF